MPQLEGGARSSGEDAEFVSCSGWSSWPVPDSFPLSPSPPRLAARLALPRVGCMSSSSLITMLPVACACSLWPSSRLSASPGSMVSMDQEGPQIRFLSLLSPSSTCRSVTPLGKCFAVQGSPLNTCFGAHGLSCGGFLPAKPWGICLADIPSVFLRAPAFEALPPWGCGAGCEVISHPVRTSI